MPPLTYPRTHRLSSPLRFKAVFDARVRETRGPIIIYTLPNQLSHSRLGLSVSRRVGTAPRRNRIKRLLREAFRSFQHEMPGNYDIVVVPRPHVPLQLPDYQKSLQGALAKLHAVWARKTPVNPTEPTPPSAL